MTVVAGSGWDNFKDAELVGAPDTYVKVSVTGTTSDAKTHTTATFTDQRVGPRAQPYFNETFDFPVTETELAVLLITVYDKDTVSQDDFLGAVQLSREHVAPGREGRPPVQRGGRVRREGQKREGVSRGEARDR